MCAGGITPQGEHTSGQGRRQKPGTSVRHSHRGQATSRQCHRAQGELLGLPIDHTCTSQKLWQGPAFKLGFTAGEPPLSCWKIEGGAELLINTVSCELAAIKVSLRRRMGCSSAFCWRSPWQEPPEKQYKDGRVFMEASEVHEESHWWWNWCKIRHRSEVLLFFPHHKKLISLLHTRLCREVSAAQVSCPPAAVIPKNRVGFSRWNKFRQIYKVIVRIKMVLIRKASPLQVREEKSYLVIFCSYQEDRWKCKCTHICRFEH